MKKKKALKRLKYFVLYWFVRALLFISARLPRTWWLGFCGLLGRLAYGFLPRYSQLTQRHLTIAFGSEKNPAEIKKLARQSFVMLAKNAGDIFRSITVGNLATFEKFVTTTGFENFESANAKGKGVIFLTAHLGAFDLQVTNMALRGLQPNIIGTSLKDPRLNELLVGYRGAYGAIAIPRGKETFGLIKALKKGGSVAILIDQDTKVKSVFVDFFGKLASTPVGAAVLAIKTGAAVVPTFIHLGEDSKQHMEILSEIPVALTGNEEADVLAATQAFTHVIESKIREYPDQWVWLHERWKTRPESEVNSNN